jgi:hypothetical protein
MRDSTAKRKDMRRDFGPKKLKLKRGDIRVKTRGVFTALVWKDRREVYMLTNTDPPPPERNFCDYANHPVKPHIVEQHTVHYTVLHIHAPMEADC